MVYTLTITSSGERELKKLPKTIRATIIEKVSLIAKNPLKGESLRGKYRGKRSLHFTIQGVAYRAIYEVGQGEITIHLVGTRENIYKRLEHIG